MKLSVNKTSRCLPPYKSPSRYEIAGLSCQLHAKQRKEEAVSDITTELVSSRRSLRINGSKDMLCLKKTIVIVHRTAYNRDIRRNKCKNNKISNSKPLYYIIRCVICRECVCVFMSVCVCYNRLIRSSNIQHSKGNSPKQANPKINVISFFAYSYSFYLY